jgi:hypothetical protein
MSSDLAARRAVLAATAPDRTGPRWAWILTTMLVWTIGFACAAFFWSYLNHGVHGVDSRAYWAAARHSHLYSGKPGELGAYLYSPAFATLIWPLAQLPMGVFVGTWMVIEAATFVWLLRPLGIRWGVPAFCLCMAEIVIGNIYAFLAVVAVVGLRQPIVWALPLLTKITPGLGPIWFAVRREWRMVAWSLGATAIIAAVSFVLTPHQWTDWIDYLTNHRGENQVLLPVRAVLAVALTIFAARRDIRWLIVVAMLLANPMVFHSEMALTILAGIPRLARRKSGQPGVSAQRDLEDRHTPAVPHLSKRPARR